MIVKTAREELIRFKGKAIGLGVFSLLGTLGIVGQAWFFAVLLEKTIFEGLPLDEVWSTVTWLIASVVLRMVATYCQERNGGQFGGAGQTRFAPKNLASFITFRALYR